MKNTNEKNSIKKASKQKIIVSCLIFLIVVSVSTMVAMTTDIESWMYELGRNYINEKNHKGTILYKGDHIILYDSSEFNGLEPIERQERIDKALRGRALFYLAQKEGIVVSDDEVKKFMETSRDGINKASNSNEFLAMLSGMGMTEDEYWNSEDIKQEYAMSIAMGKLIQIQKDKFIKEFKDNPDVDIQAKVTEWIDENCIRVLEEDNVQKVEP